MEYNIKKQVRKMKDLGFSFTKTDDVRKFGIYHNNRFVGFIEADNGYFLSNLEYIREKFDSDTLDNIKLRLSLLSKSNPTKEDLIEEYRRKEVIFNITEEEREEVEKLLKTLRGEGKKVYKYIKCLFPNSTKIYTYKTLKDISLGDFIEVEGFNGRLTEVEVIGFYEEIKETDFPFTVKEI